MKIVFLFLISFTTLQLVTVSCECTFYLKCVVNFFADGSKFDDSVVTETENDFHNVPTNISSSIIETAEREEKTFNSLLSKVSSYLSEQLKNMFNVKSETQYQTQEGDSTNVFVKIYDIENERLDNQETKGDNRTSQIYKEIAERDILNDEIKSTTGNDNSVLDITSALYLDTANTRIQHITTLPPIFTSPKINKIENNKNNNKKSDSNSGNIATTSPLFFFKKVPVFDEKDSYYEIADDNSTDYPIIDYIDVFKDTTNEHIGFTTDTILTNFDELIEKESNRLSNEIDNLDKEDQFINFDYNLSNDSKLNILPLDEKNKSIKRHCVSNTTSTTITDVVFPWIGAIFIRNGTTDQFEYYCDGALLSSKAVTTAARCFVSASRTIDPSDVIVLLGKRSLSSTGPDEKVFRVTKINIHPNFTTDVFENNLAIMILDESVSFDGNIQPACLDNEIERKPKLTATTGWRLNGDLTPIYFENKKSSNCKKNSQNINTFCAVYGNDVTTCPSHGGLYISKSTNGWSLKGILTSDPQERGICFVKTVSVTSLSSHHYWIDNLIS